MPVWYSVDGSLKVKDCLEARAIVERFCKTGGTDLFADYTVCGDDTALVEFGGGVECSRGCAADLEARVKDLGAFVVTPSFLKAR
jgi:hypothetical protein